MKLTFRLILGLGLLAIIPSCGNHQRSDSGDSASTNIEAPDSLPEFEVELPEAKNDTILMKTNMGDMKLVVFGQTPLHSKNFIKLCSSNFYDGLLFHRVIPGFMIQGGDPNSKDSDPENDGMGGPGYTIPNEINSIFKHKRGTLAAARDNNPQKASSGSQFYICHADAPHLNNDYTIFGELIEGFETLDKIAAVKTITNDVPSTPVKIISTKVLSTPVL